MNNHTIRIGIISFLQLTLQEIFLKYIEIPDNSYVFRSFEHKIILDSVGLLYCEDYGLNNFKITKEPLFRKWYRSGEYWYEELLINGIWKDKTKNENRLSDLE